MQIPLAESRALRVLERWKHLWKKAISKDAKNLTRMRLKMNPKDRYTAEQTLNHEWIFGCAPKATGSALQAVFLAITSGASVT